MVCRTSNESKELKVCIGAEKGSQRSSESPGAPEKPMLNNDTYDLMEQILAENKSLWRIKNNYKKDSIMDNEVREV